MVQTSKCLFPSLIPYHHLRRLFCFWRPPNWPCLITSQGRHPIPSCINIFSVNIAFPLCTQRVIPKLAISHERHQRKIIRRRSTKLGSRNPFLHGEKTQLYGLALLPLHVYPGRVVYSRLIQKSQSPTSEYGWRWSRLRNSMSRKYPTIQVWSLNWYLRDA